MDNVKEMHAAMEMLRAALADIESLKYQAIPRAELTARMNSWCKKLTPVMVEFDKKPPIVTNDDVLPAQGLFPQLMPTGFGAGMATL